jgi:hypothetical protein
MGRRCGKHSAGVIGRALAGPLVRAPPAWIIQAPSAFAGHCTATLLPVIIKDKRLDQTQQHDLADTVGTDLGRFALLQEIVAKVGDPDPQASDEELDLWWGSVEIDRLASGLTLATIGKLAEPSGDDEPAGPWIQTSDESGDGPTQLTASGRAAIRRIRGAERDA